MINKENDERKLNIWKEEKEKRKEKIKEKGKNGKNGIKL